MNKSVKLFREQVKKRKVGNKHIKISLTNAKTILEFASSEKFLKSGMDAVDIIINQSLEPRNGNLITKKDIRKLENEIALLHLGD